MTSVALREATVDDLDVVVGWIDSVDAMVSWSGDAFAWPLSKAQVVAALEQGDTRTFAALDSSEALTGFARLTRVAAETVQVGWIVVDPARRGERIGAALVQALVAEAFAMAGVQRLELAVLRDNVTARRLYHRAGFKPTAPAGEFRAEGRSWIGLRMALLNPALLSADPSSATLGWPRCTTRSTRTAPTSTTTWR